MIIFVIYFLIDHHAGRRSFFTNNHSFKKNTQINLNAMLTRPPRGARPAPHQTGPRAANEMNEKRICKPTNNNIPL